MGRDLLPNLNSVLELRSRPQFSGPKPGKKKKFFEFPVSQYFKLLKFKEADLTSSIWVHFDYLNNINAKNENIRKSFFDIRQFPTPEWSYFDALGRILTLEENFEIFIINYYLMSNLCQNGKFEKFANFWNLILRIKRSIMNPIKSGAMISKP